eukprot:GHVN01053779.1.p1 GENE.GHVN01053779.1~~GHVN01053779.1.p1  ORF type:complete len:468 (+),score=21.65 GHVN01053779.1:158-1405(+)
MLAYVFALAFYAIIGLPAFYLVYVLLYHHPSLRDALVSVLKHPSEAWVLFQYYLHKHKVQIPPTDSEDAKFCFESLLKVSRSFSAVILQLPEELRLPICVNYLVCRALDTLEDDMTIPKSKKVELLRSFPSKMQQRGHKYTENYGAQNVDEMKLLHNFDKVISVYKALDPKFQKTIHDCAKEMAYGMAEFQTKTVKSMEDYEQYCYYVAGVVGKGLTGIFDSCGLEPEIGKQNETLQVSMGKFLQKTNIIRDYLEDIEQAYPRVFYPEVIWSKYVAKVEDLKDPRYELEALSCLNHMVTDAVSLVGDCLTYMWSLRDPAVFKFCAVPQVMAISTLERCYNNYNVFKESVKIRKGEAVQLMFRTDSMDAVLDVFEDRLDRMLKRIPSKDPNARNLQEVIAKQQQKCSEFREIIASD